MARRKAGLGAINKGKLVKEKFAAKGSEIADLQLSHVSSQLDTFRKHLEEFARQHKNDIRKDPEFRGHFQQMCARIGVDPLASSKGFWAQALGVGDFYYELGVQIIEICLATRNRNGGLMSFDELRKRILATSGKTRRDVSENLDSVHGIYDTTYRDINCVHGIYDTTYCDIKRAIGTAEQQKDDMARAIKKLRLLGGGFAVIPVGGRRLVQSVPGELNMDHTAVLQKADATAYTSMGELVEELGWTELRAKSILDHLVREGMSWVDDQGGGERLYWFPGLFTET